MGWVKLERGNDWGVEYFALPGKKLTPTGCASLANGIKFEEGAWIDIRWPDGHWDERTIKHKMIRTEVHDHGKVYGCEYQLAGLEVDTYGIKHWLPLDAVEVREEAMPKRETDT